MKRRGVVSGVAKVKCLTNGCRRHLLEPYEFAEGMCNQCIIWLAEKDKEWVAERLAKLTGQVKV